MIRDNKYKIMKPKRRVYCYLANRQKMCFETEGEALKFIEYNSKNPKEWDQGKVPVRAYYCSLCCGWHITSHKEGRKPIEEDIRLQNEKIDSVIMISKSTLDSELDKAKKKVKEINIEMESIKIRLRKDKMNPLPTEDLESIKIRITEINEEVSKLRECFSFPRLERCYKNAKELYNPLFDSFYNHGINKFIERLREIDTLLDFGMIEESKEQLGDVTMDVENFEKEIGDNKKKSLGEIKDLIEYYRMKIEK